MWRNLWPCKRTQRSHLQSMVLFHCKTTQTLVISITLTYRTLQNDLRWKRFFLLNALEPNFSQSAISSGNYSFSLSSCHHFLYCFNQLYQDCFVFLRFLWFFPKKFCLFFCKKVFKTINQLLLLWLVLFCVKKHRRCQPWKLVISIDSLNYLEIPVLVL